MCFSIILKGKIKAVQYCIKSSAKVYIQSAKAICSNWNKGNYADLNIILGNYLDRKGVTCSIF